MLRFTVAIASILVYGFAVLFPFPPIGSEVGAVAFVPIVVIGWLYGARVGTAGAIVVGILNALVLAGTDSQAPWLVPAVAGLIAGASIGYASDLRQELGRRQEALVDLADRDHLTGLLNRAAFEEALEGVLARTGVHAVMYMDLDGFKGVNDTFGHATGDRLLGVVAERLANTVRSSDVVARLGGDQFVIIAPDLGSDEDAAALARRLVGTMKEPITMGGVPLPVTLSVGVAVAPADGVTADELLHAADQAMYRAKENGKDGVFFPGLRAPAPQDRVTPFALQRGIREHEFRLFYQPLIHLPSGTVAGFEALVRWQHPQLGVLAPAAFLAMAEETELILPLGEWVVREACRQAVTWQEFGGEALTVAVNVSAAQVARPDFVQVVRRALQDSGLPPARLELEITETMLIRDLDRVSETVQAIAREGVRIAVDDFGSGYSSLSYLHRLAFDTLKIDRSFMLDALTKASDAGRAGTVVRSIVRLAHDLGMTVVAEGVDTPAQADFLARIGSDFAQGYLFAKPIPSEDLYAWAGTLDPDLRVRTASWTEPGAA